MLEAKVRKLTKLTSYVSLSCFYHDNKGFYWTLYDDSERIHKEFNSNRELFRGLDKRIKELEAENA